MTTVFLGGSRHISRLNAQIRDRLDRIVEKKLRVVVGDANGADKAIQRHLYDRRYTNVQVFCAGSICRNNVGRWEVRSVESDSHQRGFQFYSLKDREMTSEATIGMMLWDGKSIGTLLNMVRLLRNEKKVVVYAAPQKRFWELRNLVEWGDFMKRFDPSLQRKVEEKASLEAPSEHMSAQARLAL